MYCYRGTCTDQAGNRLSGWFVECVLSGVVQSIFADNSGTPIVSVSGVANRAKTDPRGNFYFFVGDGIFDLNYYDSAGVFQFQETHFTMQSYGLNAASFPTTRAALAALPNDTNAYLLESGREGWFSWSSANLSAMVALDTQQGLYVAPASDLTGASGAWVRQVQGDVYNLEWWGMTPTYGVNGHVPFQAAFTMIAAIGGGGTLELPGYTMTLSTNPINTANGLRVVGRGMGVTKIKANPALDTTPATGFWATRPLIMVRAEGCLFTGITFEHVYHTSTSGGGFALHWDTATGTTLTGTGGAARKGFEVAGCRFENCSEGVILFGTCWPGSHFIASHAHIHHNEFRNIDYQAISVFGADNVHIHDNDIHMSNWTVARFTPAIRIIGSQKVWVHDNFIRGPGTVAVSGDNRAYCFYTGTMGQATSLATTIRRNSADVTIVDNTLENFIICGELESCEGTLRIEGNSARNPLSTATLNYFLRFLGTSNANGVRSQFGDVVIADNIVEGVTRFALAEAAYIKRLSIRDNLFVCNDKASPAAGDAFLLNYLGYSTARVNAIEVVGNEMHAKAALVFTEIQATDLIAGCSMIVHGNRLPYTGGVTKMVDASGSGGYVYTSPTDAGQAPGSVSSQGQNARFAADTWTLRNTAF